MRMLAALLITSVGFNAGCDRPAAASRDAPKSNEELLLAAAREYRAWTRISDRMELAPALCIWYGAQVRASDSADDATHGRKLYYLYACDADAYRELSSNGFATRNDDPPAPTPLGQTLVKETWAAVESPAPPVSPEPPGQYSSGPLVGVTEDYVDPCVQGPDGKRYCAGEQGDLFMMMKRPADTPDSDEGWIYAVVSSDASTIRSAGRLENCMKCHVEQGPERQFGLRF